VDHIRVILLLCAFALGTTPTAVRAGGSVEFEQVEQLLREQPATYRWLAATLRFPDSAFAQVRFAPYFRTLGGGRMGPYVFTAQSRDSAQPDRIEVVVCTTSQFVDATGHALGADQVFSATRVIEHVSSIVVRDESQASVPALCPESGQ